MWTLRDKQPQRSVVPKQAPAPTVTPLGASGVQRGLPSELEHEAEGFRAKLRPREAIALFEQVLELEPSRASAHAGLGFCWLELRDYTRALGHLEKALDGSPTDGRALYGAAIALLELGRWEEASVYARRQASLADDDKRARGLYVLGLIDHSRGAFREAVTNLEESLRIQPQKPLGYRRARAGEIRHHYVLADCYRELHQPAKAIEHLRWVAHASRNRSRGLILELGELFLELGDDREAERCFGEILTERAEDRKATIGLGRVYLQREDYHRSVDFFSRVLKVAEDDIDALNGLADAYKGLGDLDRARRYLEQVQRRYRAPEGQLERRLRALQMERERRDAELLRVRNIAALNLMATGIAHELRQPLSMIRLAAQNARKDLENNDSSVLQEDLRDIDRSVAEIDKVIAVLRDVSAPEGEPDEAVDLAEVLDEAMALFRTQLSHREITCDLSELSGNRILGSRAALRQVLINLISNARDALVSAEDKRIKVWAVPGPSDVWLYFQDTGGGMEPAIRDQAFDPFFTTKKDGGTGLGLYICHNLIRRMGGSISIKDTAPGRGTRFELRLRRAPANVEQQSKRDL